MFFTYRCYNYDHHEPYDPLDIILESENVSYPDRNDQIPADEIH